MGTGVAAATVGLLILGVTVGSSESAAAAPVPAAPVPVADRVANTGAGVVASRVIPGIAAGARTGAGVVAELPATRTEPFGLVGVTWDPASTPTGLRVAVRVHTTGGWADWSRLAYAAGEGPSGSDAHHARAGTAPLWVGEADGVAVRVVARTGAAPTRLRLVTVEPDAAAGGATVARRTPARRHPSSGAPIGAAPDFPGLPRVISRRQWGADPRLGGACWAPRYGNTAKMIFVHHTAGSSSYSVRESPAVVRSVYAYHTQAQNWCDIGYNTLIDRFGNIYAGRRGGIRKPVRGAHAGDWNTNAVGVSLLGNFVHRDPSRRMVRALVRYAGWRLGTSFAPPRGKARVAGDRFRRISGHRDAMATSCPGGHVYERLPRIRDRVAHYLTAYDSRAEHKADRLGRRVTGQVFVGEQWLRGGTRTRFSNGRMYWKRDYGAHFLAARVLRRYDRVRGFRGPLGWPGSDLQPTRVRGARFMVFQDGRMYVGPHRRPQVLFGPVLDRYRRMHFAGSRLGLPASSVRRVRAGQRAHFRHGTIRWDRSTDTTTVVFR